jgi:hypothetical protein
LAAALPVLGLLTVIQSPHSANISTVKIINYGPADFTVEGHAVFVNGPSLCEPNEAVVSGRIVYTDRFKSACDLGLVYEKIHNSGALALVVIQTYKHSFNVFRRTGWDKETTRKSSMPMVDVYSEDVDLPALRAAGSSLRLRLSPPHDTVWYDIITSAPWGFVLRVWLPVLHFYSAAVALAEFGRLRNLSPLHLSKARAELRLVGMAICLLMGPACVVMAILQATGKWGVTCLPASFYFFFILNLEGTFLLATALLTLFMLEESRAAREHLPRRSIWRQHTGLICTLVVVLVGVDCTTGLLMMFGVDEAFGAINLVGIVMCVLLLSNAAIACSFLLQAKRLSEPLIAYLGSRAANGLDNGTPFAQSPAIGRLAFVLAVNGGLMMVMVLSLIGIFVENSTGYQDPGRFLSIVVITTTTRAFIVYWHVSERAR